MGDVLVHVYMLMDRAEIVRFKRIRWGTHSVDSKNARTSVLRWSVGCLDILCRKRWRLGIE